MKRLLTFLLFATSALAQSSTGGDHTVTSSTSGFADGGISSRFLVSGPLYSFLPLFVPNVTFPNVSGYTTLVTSSAADLQTKINTAAAGCDNGGGSGATGYLIDIPQGSSYGAGTGINLPISTCTTDWIILETQGLSWTRNTRLDPSTNVATIAKITTSTANASDFVTAANTAVNQYWLSGLELEIAGTATTGGGNVTLGASATAAQIPTGLYFDHLYVHARVTNSDRHCFYLQSGNNIAIVDSWLSDCHDPNADGMAINAYSGGPMLIQNNFIEASTENTLTCGATTGLSQRGLGIVPQDVTFQKNWVYKPLQWLPTSTSPVYEGFKWTVKNLHELKCGKRWLAQFNIFQNNWQDGQTGASVLAQALVEGTTNNIPNAPYDTIQDFTFQYNYLYGGATAFTLAGIDPTVGGKFGLRGFRFTVRNNILDNINGAVWCATCPATATSISEVLSPYDFIFDHNTITTPTAGTSSAVANDGNLISMVYYTNNVVPAGTSGFVVAGQTPNTHLTFDKYWGVTQLPTVTNNAVVAGAAAGITCSTFYTGTTCPTTFTPIGFVNYTAGVPFGDYRLCTGVNLPAAPCAAASNYIAGGANGCQANPDGTGGNANCGADVATINAGIAGINPVPLLWPDSLSGGGILLSPSSLTCNGTNTVTATPVAGSNGGSTFVQSGLDLMVHGAVLAPNSSSTSAIVFTPPSYSGALSITATQLNSPNDAVYTATNSLHLGDYVTVTGTTNSSGLFNVTNAPVTFATGAGFHVFINHFSAIGSQAETGSATSTIPVAVSNFGLPLTASLTCN